MNRDTTITVRVSHKEKAEFEEYAEESNEFNGLSDLLRGATYREMADSDGQAIDEDELVSAFEPSLREVKNELGDLKRDLNVVQENVMQDDDIEALAAELYDALPLHKDREGFEWPWPETGAEFRVEDGIQVTQRKPINENSLQEARAWSDAQAWAKYLDESVERTQRALSLCLSQYPDVAVAEENEPVSDMNLRRYFRKEM